MNRVKVWVFTLLVVAAGLLAARATSVSRRSAAIAALDARLSGAAALVSASVQAVGREAGAAAALLPRDDAFAAALRPKPAAAAPAPKGRRRAAPEPAATADAGADDAAVRAAAREALGAAERSLGFALPPGTVVAAANRESLASRGDSGEADGDATAFLRGAVAGQPRRGFVRHEGALWYGAASPIGDGGGAVVLVPLDAAWAKSLAAASGADVTLAAPGLKPVSTARPGDQPALQSATKRAGAADVGRVAQVDVSFGPVKVPPLPDPLGGGPALRARALPLDGNASGFVIASLPAAPAVVETGVFAYRALAALALVLLAGLVVGALIRPTEAAAQVPAPLYAAALRIEKGDFAARAPTLAGKLGTVSAALNRAAEIAGPAQAARGPVPSDDEHFQAPAAPARPPPVRLEPEAFAFPPRPAPVAPPAVAPLPPEPAPAPRSAPAAASAAAAVSAAAAAPLDGDEEGHWQQVFQEFLRTRSSCGEPTEALTYDRFRQKLETNRAQLVTKYGCKTVRFQVYVKEGKAALKATPVK